MIKNDKEIKPSYLRYSEFHVNVCYNLQPVHNELTPCVHTHTSPKQLCDKNS